MDHLTQRQKMLLNFINPLITVFFDVITVNSRAPEYINRYIAYDKKGGFYTVIYPGGCITTKKLKKAAKLLIIGN